MMLRSTLIPAVLLLALAAPLQAETPARTQLEAAAGIHPSEAGLYSNRQLALIKSVNDRKYMSDGLKKRRIDLIKKGRILGITF